MAAFDDGRVLSYTPDELITIAEKLVAVDGDRLVLGAAEQVPREPFEKFYNVEGVSGSGDVVRSIDTLGNARFVRTGVELAREHRLARLVDKFDLAGVDLIDTSVGEEIGTDALEVLTAADLAEGLAAALTQGFRR